MVWMFTVDAPEALARCGRPTSMRFRVALRCDCLDDDYDEGKPLTWTYVGQGCVCEARIVVVR